VSSLHLLLRKRTVEVTATRAVRRDLPTPCSVTGRLLNFPTESVTDQGNKTTNKYFLLLWNPKLSRNSSGCGQHNSGVEVPIPTGTEISTAFRQVLGSPSLFLVSGTLYPVVRRPGCEAECSPPRCQEQVYVELYLHSAIRLRSVVIN
jgi:hypothetical protein